MVVKVISGITNQKFSSMRRFSWTGVVEITTSDQPQTFTTGIIDSTNQTQQPSVIKMVEWVPRNPKLLQLRVPRLPRFNPPIMRKPPVPLRTDSTISQRKRYQRARAKWAIDAVIMEDRRKDYIKQYDKRVAKYEQYKVFYDSVQAKIRKGVPERRKRNVAKKYRELHMLNKYVNTLNPSGFNFFALAHSGTSGIENQPFVGYSYADGFSILQTTIADEIKDIAVQQFGIDLVPLARRKIAQKVGNQQLHVGNIVAERMQTIKMLVSTVKRIAGMMSAKGIYRSLFPSDSLMKDLSGLTLEYSFGWAPLYNDLFAGLKLLAELNNSTTSDKLMVRGKVTHKIDGVLGSDVLDQVTSVLDYLLPDAPSYERITNYDRVAVKGVMECSFVYEYTITNPQLATLQSLGLINPLSVAWELLPWSFVIDWFLDVSTFVNSLTGDAGLTFSQGTEAFRTDLKIDGHYKFNNSDLPSPLWNATYPCGRGQFDFHHISKIRVPAFDVEESYLLSGAYVPKLKDPFSLMHEIEAIALFIQRLRR